MKPLNVTLRQMRAFASLARYGGFRAAAAAFNLSQSALSSAIREMERELGVPLFDRTTRRVELTPAGRQLLPDVERILAELDATLRDVQSAGEAQRGRVVIASIFSMATHVLPVVIHQFKAAHPNVRVILLDYTASAVQASARAGEADLGICARNDLEGDLHFETLAIDPFVAILPAKHPLSKSRDVPLKELLRFPFITMAKGTQIRSLTDSALRARGLHASPAYEASEPATIQAMVEANLGVSVLPKRTLSNANVLVRRLAEPGFERQLGIVARPGHSLTPPAEAFRRQLFQYFSEGNAAGSARKGST